MAETAIEWTKYSFNPWHGCQKIDPECKNCYAKDWMDAAQYWGKDAPRRNFSKAHYAKPGRWNRSAKRDGKRELVFCMSMGDLFEDRADLIDHRNRLFGTIDHTPYLIWLLLTKRPENFEKMLPWMMFDGAFSERKIPDNVMLGVTAGTQKSADTKIPILLNTPAMGHFVSYEPALERVDFSRWLGYRERENKISWIIAGAERVKHDPKLARPAKLDWFRQARDQAVENDAAFFLKQKIEDGRKISMPELDGKVWAEYPDCITSRLEIKEGGLFDGM